MFLNFDIVNAWYKAGHVKICNSGPLAALQALERNKSAAHFELTRKNGSETHYIPDKVAFHRRQLLALPRETHIPYDPKNYDAYEGIQYPGDLSMVLGLWSVPLDFCFDNLIVLNLDMATAIYWAIPIITATSNLFRRLIIQRVDESDMPFAFPFTKLDHCLVALPLVKVILIYRVQASKETFADNLLLLKLRKNLCFIQERKLVSFISRQWFYQSFSCHTNWFRGDARRGIRLYFPSQP